MQHRRSRRLSRRSSQTQPAAPAVYSVAAVLIVLGAILGTAWIVKSLTGELLPALIGGLLVAGALMMTWVRIAQRGTRR